MCKMPRYLLILAVLFCFPSMLFAESLSREDANGKLTLLDEPCKLGGWFDKWKAAKWFFKGKDYEACWSFQSQVVVILDSDGTISVAPPQTFKPDVGV